MHFSQRLKTNVGQYILFVLAYVGVTIMIWSVNIERVCAEDTEDMLRWICAPGYKVEWRK